MPSIIDKHDQKTIQESLKSMLIRYQKSKLCLGKQTFIIS